MWYANIFLGTWFKYLKQFSFLGYGFAELVEKYVLEEKIDSNLECAFNDLSSITPLHFCSGIGPDPITPDRIKCIEILMQNGAKIDHLTSRNDTPLHWATKLAGIFAYANFKRHV